MIVIGGLAALSGLSFLTLPGFLALRHDPTPASQGEEVSSPAASNAAAT
jgi:hypothetical protein